MSAQELLNIVAQDLEKFDSVCMATSIHTLANLRCTKAQYQSVFESSEMMRLMAAVCKPQPPDRCDALESLGSHSSHAPLPMNYLLLYEAPAMALGHQECLLQITTGQKSNQL